MSWGRTARRILVPLHCANDGAGGYQCHLTSDGAGPARTAAEGRADVLQPPARGLIGRGRFRPPAGGNSTVMPNLTQETKAELYARAARLGIKGRSKMNKGQLKAAVERREANLDVMQPRA